MISRRWLLSILTLLASSVSLTEARIQDDEDLAHRTFYVANQADLITRKLQASAEKRYASSLLFQSCT